MTQQLLLKIGFIIISVIAIIVIGRQILTTVFRIKTLKNRVESSGEIIDFRTEKDLDNYTTYRPSVKFMSDTEKEYTIETEDFLYTKPVLGRKVKVTYDRAHPENAIVNIRALVTFRIFLLIFLLAVLSFIAVGILF